MFGKDKDKLIQPVIFHENGEEFSSSPVSYIDQDINKLTKYAITKLTNKGAYVRGNMLYFSFNGIEIYTEIDNIIFVNESNKTLFIRSDNKLQDNIAPTDPEMREYVILFADLGWDECGNDEDFPLRWQSVTGRTEAYELIKTNAPVIDIDKSIVLVETVPLKDAYSVRDFMNYIKNSDIIIDESFDINDYAGGKYI